MKVLRAEPVRFCVLASALQDFIFSWREVWPAASGALVEAGVTAGFAGGVAGAAAVVAALPPPFLRQLLIKV